MLCFGRLVQEQLVYACYINIRKCSEKCGEWDRRIESCVRGWGTQIKVGVNRG